MCRQNWPFDDYEKFDLFGKLLVISLVDYPECTDSSAIVIQTA